eukprot:g2121.t1
MLRILYLTLEYSAGTFSGNGVYSQAQVLSIAQHGHQVMVISAKPHLHKDPLNHKGATELLEIPVSTWGRLDYSSPWKEFASKIESTVFRRVCAFEPDVIVTVDWSAFPVYEKLKEQYIANKQMPPPMVWSVYRVFTRTANTTSVEFVKSMESQSFTEAAACIVLSQADCDFVMETLAKRRAFRVPYIVFPHIRDDVVQIPMLKSNSKRNYITCCVRLSEEKNPQRFVEIVEEMKKRNLFLKFKITPLMCGSSKTEYAQRLKRRLKAAVPDSVIPEEFLGPERVAEIFAKTRLNIHPCHHDAYGMTIVEAASQGAPSLVQSGGSIGAAEFLRSNQSEIFEVDYCHGVETTVDFIHELLLNEAKLEHFGNQASIRARDYTAKHNAQEVLKILTHVCC